MYQNQQSNNTYTYLSESPHDALDELPTLLVFAADGTCNNN